MINEFGKFLRKYRIDKNLLLKDMAKELKWSTAYLSSIETSKREITQTMYERIVCSFKFTDHEKKELEEAMIKSKKNFKITLDNKKSPRTSEVVNCFVRKINELSDTQIEDIYTILNGSVE